MISDARVIPKTAVMCMREPLTATLPNVIAVSFTSLE